MMVVKHGRYQLYYLCVAFCVQLNHLLDQTLNPNPRHYTDPKW